MSDVAVTDLEELTACQGWLWLKAQADREFGAVALVEKLRHIASNAAESPELRQAKTEQAFVSQAAILGLLEMPAREIQRRKDATRLSADDFSEPRRRGGTL